MFVDKAKLHIRAGKGGNGAIAFHREKFIDRGGPSGGDGGRGGSIFFKSVSGLTTLIDFKYIHKIIGNDGENGQIENRYGKSLYEILNGKLGAVGREFAKAKNEGCKNPGDLFMKMWIFIHGSACMSITGDYDLDMKETTQLLRTVYKGFLI